ncbi:hypothetical protein V6N13_011557 [Hibiscus sabdariffa]|uniref:Uncharacterized protein n=1 Tax=Hibiscus sabdariffa TaxID=183260 RepID=A0ABR2SD76_9ROSI
MLQGVCFRWWEQVLEQRNLIICSSAAVINLFSGTQQHQDNKDLWQVRHQAGLINGVPEESVPWKMRMPQLRKRTTPRNQKKKVALKQRL